MPNSVGNALITTPQGIQSFAQFVDQVVIMVRTPARIADVIHVVVACDIHCSGPVECRFDRLTEKHQISLRALNDRLYWRKTVLVLTVPLSKQDNLRTN